MNLGEMSSSAQLGMPALSILLAIPAVSALAVLATRSAGAARSLALVASGLVLALSVFLLSVFQGGTADFQLVERAEWLPAMGIQYLVGVDGISILFIPLTALVFFVITLASGGKALDRGFWASLLLLESATLGIYLSLDLVLFFCFFELALIPTFWLTKSWGLGSQRQSVAIRYLVLMLAGSLPLFVGFLMLAFSQSDGSPTFDLLRLLSSPIPVELQTLVFALLAIGFAVKGPMLPFHTWMPSMAMEGPVAVGTYLLGLKVGAYGFLRFVLPLTPNASVEYAGVMLTLGVVAVVYAGLIAISQPNLRRLLAFSSISHIGLILAASFSSSIEGIQGAILLMVNAGLATAALFLCAGFLYQRLGTTDASTMGGLSRRFPRLTVFFFISGLALIGVPGTSGFAGELLAMTGAFKASWVYGSAAAMGVVLGACYLLVFFQRAFLGTSRAKASPRVVAADLGAAEMLAASLLIASVIGLGLYPKAMLGLTDKSVSSLTQRLKAAEASRALPVPQAPQAPVAGDAGSVKTLAAKEM